MKSTKTVKNKMPMYKITLTIKNAPNIFSTEIPEKYVPQTFKKLSTVNTDGLSTFKNDTKRRMATKASINRNHNCPKKRKGR